MQGKTFREFWEERGFSPQEVQKFKVPLETDLHRTIEETGWWQKEVLSRIAVQEAAQNGQPLTREQVLAIISDLFDEMASWWLP
jgi:hypothetical protein